MGPKIKGKPLKKFLGPPDSINRVTGGGSTSSNVAPSAASTLTSLAGGACGPRTALTLQTKAKGDAESRRQDRAARARGKEIQRIYMREKYNVHLPTPRQPRPRRPSTAKQRGDDLSGGPTAGAHKKPIAARSSPGTDAAAAAFLVLAAAAVATDVNQTLAAARAQREAPSRALARERQRLRIIASVEQNHRVRPRQRPSAAIRQCNAGIKGRVSFRQPIVTCTRVYDKTKPAAASGPSLCADSGCTTILATSRMAAEANLPNLGPSGTSVRVANGGISHATHATEVPLGLGTLNQGSVLKSGDLVDSLCGIKPMADSGLISIFHPGEEGFAAYRREDVTITYLAPPVIEDY